MALCLIFSSVLYCLLLISLCLCLSAYMLVSVSLCLCRYCSNCKQHQRGTVKQSLYRLPDILIVHIKRFNMTARFREKIRAKVHYPLQGLDMRPFTFSCTSTSQQQQQGGEGVSAGAGGGNSSSSSSGNEDVYDLYGVSNHLGERVSE